jgi:hypothetical protein
MVLIFTIPIRANLARLGLDKVNTFLLRFPKLALPTITRHRRSQDYVDQFINTTW